MVCLEYGIFSLITLGKKKDKGHYQENRKECLRVSLFIQGKLCPGKACYKNESSNKVMLRVDLK